MLPTFLYLLEPNKRGNNKDSVVKTNWNNFDECGKFSFRATLPINISVASVTISPKVRQIYKYCVQNKTKQPTCLLFLKMLTISDSDKLSVSVRVCLGAKVSKRLQGETGIQGPVSNLASSHTTVTRWHSGGTWHFLVHCSLMFSSFPIMLYPTENSTPFRQPPPVARYWWEWNCL